MSQRSSWIVILVLAAAMTASSAVAGGAGPDCDPPNFCIWADVSTCGRCFSGVCEADGLTACQLDGDCLSAGGGICLNDATQWRTCTLALGDPFGSAECAGVGIGQCWGTCVNDPRVACLADFDCTDVGGACDIEPIGAGTEADPFCRIQRAYNGARQTTTPQNPVIIPVNPGTYPECVTAWGFVADEDGFWDDKLSEDRPVELIAVDWLASGDNTTTVIDQSQALVQDGAQFVECGGAALRIGGTGASVEGFTITGGDDAGVFARGGVTITNNVIEGNDSELGGGVYGVTASCYYSDNVSMEITNNRIEGNNATAPLFALRPECQICTRPAPCGTGDGGGVFVSLNDKLDCGTNDAVDISNNEILNNTVTNFNPDPCTAICLNSGTCSISATSCIDDNDCPTDENCEFLSCTDVPPTCPDGQGPCEATLPLTANGGGIALVSEISTGQIASATITQNLISGNSIEQDPFSEGYGGGIYVVSLGLGEESVEISENCIGGSDRSDCENSTPNGNFSTLDGGGISARVRPFAAGLHQFTIEDNTVMANTADRDGGGMELLTEAIELGGNPTLDGAVLDVEGNYVGDNTANRDGGGVKAVADVRRTVEADARLRFLLSGNRIADNTSALGAGGALVIPIADYDDFNGGVCESNPAPAESRIRLERNLIIDNTANASDPSVDVIGGGVLALPLTFGDARAIVEIDQTTIAGNTIGENGIVGGVETQAITYEDCQETGTFGQSNLSIDKSIVANNTCPDSLECIGVGGPPIGVDVLVAAASSTSVFGHSPNYENSLFPGAPDPPAGNISGNPQLDAGTYFPAACSPVFDRFCHGNLADCGAPCGTYCSEESDNPLTACTADGECPNGTCVEDCDGDCGKFCSALSDNPLAVCTDDIDCPNGSCVQDCVEEAGFYCNPDVSGDGRVDGQEVLAIAASNGASEGDPAFDPSVDINGNGMNDGDDLSFISSEFGQVCEP